MDATSNSFLGSVLLGRVSPDERSDAVRDIIRKLEDVDLSEEWLSGFRLAARILLTVPNEGDEHALVNLLLARVETEQNDVSVQVALDSLEQNQRIRTSFFHSLVRDLEKAVKILLQEENAYAVPSEIFVMKYLQGSSREAQSRTAPIEEDKEGTVATATKRNLILIRALAPSKKPLSDALLLHKLLAIQLTLAGTHSQELSLTARNLATVLIPDALKTEKQEDISQMLFSRIRNLMEAPHPSPCASAAPRLWFQWILNIQEGDAYLTECLHGTEYWQLLQSTLFNGHSEERKFGLATLQTSVHLIRVSLSNDAMIFDYENSEISRKAYERFCLFFQTIVLGRYPNQVEECLHDLEVLVCSDKVHHTWIEVLLKSVFHRDVQETIRKLIGNWYMDLASRKPMHFVKHDKFLTQSFLPWATTGILFTNSVRKNQGLLTCEHGERLSEVVRNLVRNAPKPGKSEILNTVLSYLDKRGDSIYAFAISYVLKGIADALNGNPLDYRDADLACTLALRIGTREIPRDLMTSYCIEMCGGAEKSGKYEDLPSFRAMKTNHDRMLWASSGVASFHRRSPDHGIVESPATGEILTPASHLDIGSKPDPAVDMNPLIELQEQILQSKYRLLAGAGLLRTCVDLSKLFSPARIRNTPMQTLQFITEAVWDETETQEYMKDVIMKLPHILLHPTLLERSIAENEELTTLIRKAIHYLYYLAENRIYMLAPVMNAVRRAILIVPESSKALDAVDLFIRFSNNPPIPNVEFLIEASLADKLQKRCRGLSYAMYYGRREGFAYASTFDLLNRLGRNHHSFSGELLDTLILPWITQSQPVPVVTKWKKTEHLQMILILCDVCFPQLETSEIESYLEKFHAMLAPEPLPRHRFLIEWMILRIYLMHPVLRENLLNTLRVESNGKLYTVSLIKMALRVSCFGGAGEDFALQFMALLVPFCASSKVAIRHESQWSIPKLWNHCLKSEWKQITTNPAFTALSKHVLGIDKYNMPFPARSFESFDPEQDHTMNNLFTGGYLNIEPSEERIVANEDFISLWEEDEQDESLSNLPDTHIPLGVPCELPIIPKPTKHAKDSTSPTEAAQPENVPLQTKGLSISQPTLDQSSTRRGKYPLILCASLIDNPFNLGGLSRAAEIFGASSLLVGDLAHTTTSKFTSVAVTSHLHLPIEAVPPEDTPAYLRSKKTEGFTVVGVEQTDQSIVLGQNGSKLPKKCVLVMGSEKEGIPARALLECDVCVEIRQEGVTRSLNVQTAASIVLYEYQRQWYGKSDELSAA